MPTLNLRFPSSLALYILVAANCAQTYFPLFPPHTEMSKFIDLRAPTFGLALLIIILSIFENQFVVSGDQFDVLMALSNPTLNQPMRHTLERIEAHFHDDLIALDEYTLQAVPTATQSLFWFSVTFNYRLYSGEKFLGGWYHLTVAGEGISLPDSAFVQTLDSSKLSLWMLNEWYEDPPYSRGVHRLAMFKAHLNQLMRYLGLAIMFVIWCVESPSWIMLAKAMISALCLLKVVHLVAYMILGCGLMLLGNLAGSILVYLATAGVVSITWTFWKEYQAEHEILLFGYFPVQLGNNELDDVELEDV